MSATANPETSKERTDAMAAMDAVEIKVTVRPDQELRAERTMELNEDTADVRVIYFYDTPSLDLFNAGVALRARLVKGGRRRLDRQVPPGRGRQHLEGLDAA